MKKSLLLWQLAGFVFTSAAGTLLHFVYEWSSQSILFAPFSAVNESIWEHMKLLFFPMLIFAFAESHYIGRQYPSFWYVKLAGIVSGLTLVPVLYYTYTGAFGVSADWFNIAIFFLAAAAAYLPETRFLKHGSRFCLSTQTSLTLLCIIALSFVVFTFVPPSIPLFQDPGVGETVSY
ncbi:MAG: hypothetical protein K2J60_14755 [Acetatifactor sp.]|nr:hypothetical protein [Acetatifactor sp.]